MLTCMDHTRAPSFILDLFGSPNDKLELFESLFNNCLDAHAPWKTFHTRRNTQFHPQGHWPKKQVDKVTVDKYSVHSQLVRPWRSPQGTWYSQLAKGKLCWPPCLWPSPPLQVANAFCVEVKILLRDKEQRTPPDLSCLAVPTSRWRQKITCRMAITNSLCL